MKIVYCVMCEGEIECVFYDKDEAVCYVEEKMYQARAEALDEMGCDDPSEEELVLAEWKAGQDGDLREIHQINLKKYSSGDEIELSNGDTIYYDDIIERL